jgi:DegV family protein with EDD domain
LTPQKIVVDGVEHDTRDGLSFDEIDHWVRTAREHPYVLGTSAAEFAAMFHEIARRDRSILAVMTSRKIIGSYDSAVSAAKTLARQPSTAEIEVAIADSGVTDLGAGLATILAAEASRAGLGIARVREVLEQFRSQVMFELIPDTLEYLVKGGRATALRAWIANVFNVRPHAAIVDGELTILGKISASADRGEVIAEHVAKKLGAGRPVWIGVFHGNAPASAERLRASLAQRLDVRYALVRPLSPSIYLHMGPRAIGAAVVPVDRLTWAPPTLR